MTGENGVFCCALVLAGCDMGLEMVFLSGSMGMKYSQWQLADSTSAQPYQGVLLCKLAKRIEAPL